MTDLALVNANVLTMDPARPRATAVAVAGGRITTLDEIQPGASRVVDLRGATVLPGFHDAHNHMIGFGMSLAEVDLRSSAAGTLDELYAAVAPSAESGKVYGPGGFRELRGYPVESEPDRAAKNEDTARRLWELSEKLTGVTWALD